MTASTATVVPPAIEPAGRRQEPAPQRAEGVQLLGELPGSGYRRPPALARRRDGQLIKLTPLLYHLVDTIDGSRGYDQLAGELSRRIGKEASANDVRHLVEDKLRPLGVLRRADGTQPALKRSNPLLMLRPRIVVSKPQWTRRLCAPFVWLFSPVVVAPVLAAFTALTFWLLAEKGLASSLHQTFYEPSLILVLWGLVLLSMAFHEFGHAAACRYGGAEPGVMGAGLYLAWPAFYTEVSDAYRLDRRGRLRVDLGGLYFNAIFSLAVAGAWALTGDDALLLVVAVQLVQMVRQLAPFIRADGYHIVADLIGVPDLFAHIKPTLLGLLPTRWGRSEHKVLKPWARAVVAVWVLAVVPLLITILGYVVLMLPRLAATAWDSIGIQWGETTGFWGEGDVAGVVTSGLSTVLVALPMLGIFVLLGRLGRRTALRTWRGTAGRPRLRALALLGAAGVVAFVGWAWWPGDQYRPIGGDEPAPAPTILMPESTHLAGAQWLVGAPQPGVATTTAAPLLVLRAAPVLGTEAVAALSPQITLSSELGGTVATMIENSVETAPRNVPPSAESTDTQGAWPFPFDPPAAPRWGDNRAEAFNTTDGSVLSDVAVSLLLAGEGDPVDQANEAYAYASCSDCRTIAVAFQVLLIVGYTDEVAPINAAGALNFECDACNTYAFAYQLVLTLSDLPSPTVVEELVAVLQSVSDLDLDSLSAEDIYLALEEAKQNVLDILGDSLLIGIDDSVLTAGLESSSGPDGTTSESAGGTDQGGTDSTDGSTDQTTSPTTDVTEPTGDESATTPSATDGSTPTGTTDTTTTDTTTSDPTTTTDTTTSATTDTTTSP